MLGHELGPRDRRCRDVGDERVARAVGVVVVTRGRLGGAEQVLVEALPVPQAREAIGISRPERAMSIRATSRIRTGSPMSRTSTSPPRPSAPAWRTSSHASGMVMK